MVLAVSAGNEHTVIGGYNGDKLMWTSAFVTPSEATSDEYTIKLREHIRLKAPDTGLFEGAALANVSDLDSDIIKAALKNVVSGRVLNVGPGIKTGLNIRIDNPAALGANLVADAVGAMSKYGSPVIIADLSTATTFAVSDADGVFRGGAILPGIKTSLDALSDSTAVLPRVQIPLSGRYNILATSTISCMQSGAVYGLAVLTDGFITRYRSIIGDARAVLTGFYAELVAKYAGVSVTVDKNLALDGLMAIYKRNVTM
jgi:type III pantothenate kinase